MISGTRRIAHQPASAGKRVQGESVPNAPSKARRLCCKRSMIWRRIAAPACNNPGRASCTGVPTDKYVSAINSRRASASLTTTVGPVATIQPSFRWGKPHDLDSPPSENTSAGEGRPATAVIAPFAGEKGKSANTSSTIIASPCSAANWARRSKSSSDTNEPVGLLGLTRMMAAASARSRLAKSMCQCPSKRSR